MREWSKYLQKNKYSECQLITALNAIYYLTGEYIDQNSNEYEELVDLCMARNGAAISIEKVWDELGIEIKKTYLTSLDWESNLPPLPLEISIWHKAYGFHSVLAVDYEPKTDAFRITNFKWATSLKGWIFNEDLYHYLMDSATHGESKYRYRLFGIKSIS